jgi:hypothetical protein
MSDWPLEQKVRRRDEAERLVRQHGFGVIAEELYGDIAASNATGCTFVIMPFPERRQAGLVITDDGSGRFHDLNHVRETFAGKLLLTFCTEAVIHTPEGTVVFKDGKVEDLPRRRTDKGTLVRAVLDCTAEQCDLFVQHVRRLNPKPGLRVFMNGEEVTSR